jgi:hypothetical protein
MMKALSTSVNALAVFLPVLRVMGGLQRDLWVDFNKRMSGTERS